MNDFRSKNDIKPHLFDERRRKRVWREVGISLTRKLGPTSKVYTKIILSPMSLALL